MTPHIYLCLIWDTGDHELHAKEHRWLQHWKHFTWLSWRGDKLCSNGSAIYRPKCVLFHVPSMLVESGFMHDANLILLSLPDSWVNFYGNIGKTLLSLVWNISSILDNSSTLCKFLTVTNLMLVVWFYHYCQIICCHLNQFFLSRSISILLCSHLLWFWWIHFAGVHILWPCIHVSTLYLVSWEQSCSSQTQQGGNRATYQVFWGASCARKCVRLN